MLTGLLGIRESVSDEEAVFWTGMVITAGCLVAAAWVAYRTREFTVPLILMGVAVLSAILLL